MKGAVIPAILWYLVTFTPEIPAAPITLTGPLSEKQCMEFEQRQPDPYTWCQEFKIKPPPRERK